MDVQTNQPTSLVLVLVSLYTEQRELTFHAVHAQLKPCGNHSRRRACHC